MKDDRLPAAGCTREARPGLSRGRTGLGVPSGPPPSSTSVCGSQVPAAPGRPGSWGRGTGAPGPTPHCVGKLETLRPTPPVRDLWGPFLKESSRKSPEVSDGTGNPKPHPSPAPPGNPDGRSSHSAQLGRERWSAGTQGALGPTSPRRLPLLPGCKGSVWGSERSP